MNKLLIVFMFISIACNSETVEVVVGSEKKDNRYEFEMKCEYTGNFRIYRCVNKETICYKYSQFGISCFRKNRLDLLKEK